MLGKDASDAVAGVAVPERRDVAELDGSRKNLSNFALEFLKIVANQNVGAERYGDRPFSVLAKSEAWDPKVSSLFLYPAGIGNYEAGAFLQSEEFEVSNRINKGEAVGAT
jgi:hypothetical protein